MPTETHFVSVRMPQDLWQRLERLAAQEAIAMNSLINACLDQALDLVETPEGQQQIHEACALWRVRWEHRVTQRRKERLA